MTISELIFQIPLILKFVVPGFIFIKTFNFILSRKNISSNHSLIMYIVVSYTIVISIDVVTDMIGRSVMDTEKMIIAIIISLVLGYILGIVTKDPRSSAYINKLGINLTLRASIWDDFSDEKYGVWATVYITNEELIYVGIVTNYEYREESNYIALADYKVLGYDGKLIEDAKSNRYRIIIKLDNVNRVEFFYDEKSLVIKN